jgi:hypothetical protein
MRLHSVSEDYREGIILIPSGGYAKRTFGKYNAPRFDATITPCRVPEDWDLTQLNPFSCWRMLHLQQQT